MSSYNSPASSNTNPYPGPIIAGPNATEWYTLCNINQSSARSGFVVQIVAPATTTSYGAGGMCPEWLAVDGNADVWAAGSDSNNQLVLMKYVPGTTSGPTAVYNFNLPVANGMAAVNAALWISSGSTIDQISTSGSVTQIANVPGANFRDITQVGQYGGSLWAVDSGRNVIARFTGNGTESDYPIPSSGGGDGYLAPSVVCGIRSGPTCTDFYLYFSEIRNQKIARLNMNTGAIQEFTLQSGGMTFRPFDIAVDESGNVWADNDPFGSAQTGGGTTILKITLPP